jgi:hypothetical protein
MKIYGFSPESDLIRDLPDITIQTPITSIADFLIEIRPLLKSIGLERIQKAVVSRSELYKIARDPDLITHSNPGFVSGDLNTIFGVTLEVDWDLP